MKTKIDTDGVKHFTAFGKDFYYGFGAWHTFKHNALVNMNLEGFKFKKDAIAWARKR